MRANVEVAVLLEEKGRLQREISRIDGEIYRIRLACKHDGEIEYRTRTLDRLMYADTYRAANAEYREIQKRSCICSQCGQIWEEMRFSDSDWMPVNEWLDKFNR